ncbi:MAG: hypothetical protein WBG37_08815 [Desulfobacterales bacterium]
MLYPRDGAIGVGFKPQAGFHPFAVRSDIFTLPMADAPPKALL